MRDETTIEATLSDLFVVRTANECSTAGSSLPVPKMLFDEFWREGEMAILFSDAGMGKSVLAMQIAESIARGTAIEPMRYTSAPQKVLYIDLQHTDKQFEMRYAREIDGDEEGKYTDHYVFSENLLRPDINRKKAPRNMSGEMFACALGPLVMKTGAKVLIIDNITLLKRAYQSSRDELPLIRELDRLKRIYGLSILVLASTSRRDLTRPVAMGDLQAARVLGHFTDSVFAIGQSRQDETVRFIKHLRSQNVEMLHDASYLPLFRIKKLNGNFLGAKFLGYSDENTHLQDPVADPNRELMDDIKEMSADDMSIRDIARALDISKTRVHRLKNQWYPKPANAWESLEPRVSQYDFPGREEFIEAGEDPRFKGMYHREDAEGYALRSEAYVIEAARAVAGQIYRETGHAPGLAEAIVLYEQKRIARSQPPVTYPEPGPDEPKESEDLFPGLEREFDGYGRIQYIESRDPNGKPDLWYAYNSSGKPQKYERKGYAIIRSDIEETGTQDTSPATPVPPA